MGAILRTLNAVLSLHSRCHALLCSALLYSTLFYSKPQFNACGNCSNVTLVWMWIGVDVDKWMDEDVGVSVDAGEGGGERW